MPRGAWSRPTTATWTNHATSNADTGTTCAWDECLRIGHLMAAEARRIIKDAAEQKEPALFCDSINVRFPVNSMLMWGVIEGSPLKYPHNDDQSINARINLLNLGNAQVLTIPGEALPNIGFYLKRQDAWQEQPIVWPDKRSVRLHLDESRFSQLSPLRLRLRTSLGEMTGEILIEKSLELVKRTPAPDR